MRHPHSSPGRGPAARGGGPGRGRDEGQLPSVEAAVGWFAGRLPDEWFEGRVELQVDRDELLVVGTVAVPEVDAGADDAVLTQAAAAEAEAGRISRFREQTRDERMRIAREAEHRFGRKVAWGVQAGGTRQLFTTLSVPVMTRLRQPERQVLDTLVEAGVARSRSDALAWSVKLVGRNTEDWLGQLREAMTSVQQVRERGPGAG